ncbi:hypothetical protein KIL84_009743 [Mauremys mutica]|uniref:Uncharacterized protein n=1 Tax=Mauremys mutica TaxID=74926 RepID=A0A9D3XIC8_9SAUR|nr:hypothetical protein KIL84_009743 [Mauremys mutica]
MLFNSKQFRKKLPPSLIPRMKVPCSLAFSPCLGMTAVPARRRPGLYILTNLLDISPLAALEIVSGFMVGQALANRNGPFMFSGLDYPSPPTTYNSHCFQPLNISKHSVLEQFIETEK